MRSRGRTAGSHPANQIALVDSCAGADTLREGREMQVIGLESARVANADLPATSARPTCGDDGACGHRDHVGAVVCGVVHTEMRPPGSMHRV